jgi:hypothetical protein
MPTFMEHVLSEIQDPEQKKALQALPDSVVKALEKHALTEDALAKISKLDAAEKALSDFQKANEGWDKYSKNFKAAFGDNAKLEDVVAKQKQLEAEVARLKPEAERAAILAKQAEGDVVDPAKLAENLRSELKKDFVPVAEVENIVRRAVSESKHAVDFGSAPGIVNLVEHVMKAKNLYGMDLDSGTLSVAAAKYEGQPNAIERAFDDLTKSKREELSAKAESERQEKYKKDIEEAERRGSEKARHEYETSRIQGEDSGASALGVMPLNTPKDDQKGVDPTNYDSSAGKLAAEGLKMYRELEAAGKLKDIIM